MRTVSVLGHAEIVIRKDAVVECNRTCGVGPVVIAVQMCGVKDNHVARCTEITRPANAIRDRFKFNYHIQASPFRRN